MNVKLPDEKEGFFMKIEMHAHTSEGSSCAKVPATEAIKMYAEAGFDGIVITNHYGRAIVEYRDYGDAIWPGLGEDVELRSEGYLKGWRRAKEVGEALGIKVFLGMELTLDQGIEDFLLYGISEDFVLRHPDIFQWPLEKVYELCKAEGILIIQAHPCRAGSVFWGSPDCQIQDERFLDGVELNQVQDHNNNNPKVLEWIAKHPDKIVIMGSDFHKPHNVGCGWIETERDIQNMGDLVQCLKDGAFRSCCKDGEQA